MPAIKGPGGSELPPIEKYDKNGIPKKIPVDEQGNSYLTIGHFPPHLRKKYDAVEADGNSHYSNPNYYQEMYDALCGHLKPKDAAKFFITYNEYNAVALKHMDDYQAFKYIVRTGERYDHDVNAREYAERLFEQHPKKRKGYEAGMYLRRYREVLKYHPKDADASFSLAYRLYNEKNYKEALKYFKQAENIEPAYIKARMHSYMGNTYEHLNDKNNAIFHFKQAVKIEPMNQMYISDLILTVTGKGWNQGDREVAAASAAYQWEAHNDIEQAIDYIKKAIEHNPNEPLWQEKLRELEAKRQKP